MDRRERGVDVRGEVDVVEADDADVTGDSADAGRARRASRRSPSRRTSPARGRAQPVLEGAVEGGDAAIDARRPDDDALVGELDARRPRRPRDSHAAGGRSRPRDPGPPGAGGSTPRTSTSRCPRLAMYSAAACAPPTSSISTEPCSGRAIESTSTIGQAGAPDLLDLGVAVRQPDGDDAIDRRAGHRERQAAVEWRDEVEAVAMLLGRQCHALAEGAEERVAEDDAERLGRQHTDRHGLALGEHPGDRVGPCSPAARRPRGSGSPSPARAGRGVERERHGGLADAGLAGDVGDACSLGPGFHQGLDSAAPDESVGRDAGPSQEEEDARARHRANRFSKPV